MLILVLLALAWPLAAADFDVLIRNARIVDGSGNPWYRADIGIREGKVAAIGSLANASAARTIDAKERVVAPGFIDVHTHVEGGIDRIPEAGNLRHRRRDHRGHRQLRRLGGQPGRVVRRARKDRDRHQPGIAGGPQHGAAAGDGQRQSQSHSGGDCEDAGAGGARRCGRAPSAFLPG